MKKKKIIYRTGVSLWPTQRLVILLAGILTAVSAGLTVFVNFKFVYLTFFIGLMLANFALTDFCPLGVIIDFFRRKNSG